MEERLVRAYRRELRGPATYETILEAVKAAELELGPEQLSLFSTGPKDASFVSSSILRAFRLVLGTRPIESVLNPYCNAGELLAVCRHQLEPKHCLGIGNKAKAVALAEELHASPTTSYRLADPVDELPGLDQSFDLVVAVPPFGLRQEATFKLAEGELRVRRDAGLFASLYACTKLATFGLGLIVVPTRFAYAEGRMAFSKHTIREFGLSLEAYLRLPRQSLTGSVVDCALIVISRAPQDAVFVGALEGDDQHDALVVDNYRKGVEGATVGQGRLQSFEDFVGFSRLELRLRIDATAESLGATMHPLADVIEEIVHLDDRTPVRLDRELLIPRFSRLPVVTSRADVVEKKRYYLVTLLDDAPVEAGYLASFYNTPFGRMLLEAHSSGAGGTAKIGRRAIRQLEYAHVNRELQAAIVNAQERIRAMRLSLSELETGLWTAERDRRLAELSSISFGDRFEDFLETLPFPIASVGWAYHAEVVPIRKHQLLIKVFEAVAQFLATILLSAFSSELSDPDQPLSELTERLKRALRRCPGSFRAAGWGHWISCLECLGKQVHKQLGPDGGGQLRRRLATQDLGTIEMLADSRMLDLLREANNRRRTQIGHDGITSEAQIRDRISDLEGLLRLLRELFAAHWRGYRLLAPGNSRYRAGIHYYDNALLLQGVRRPFRRLQIETELALDDRYLHLAGLGERRPLPLLPLVRLSTPPATAEEALYFYSRIEPDGVRFVSFHYEPQGELVDPFPDTAAIIERLTTASE